MTGFKEGELFASPSVRAPKMPILNGVKNLPLVSRTTIGYCSSLTACVYFFFIQNTLIPSEMKTRKI